MEKLFLIMTKFSTMLRFSETTFVYIPVSRGETINRDASKVENTATVLNRDSFKWFNRKCLTLAMINTTQSISEYHFIREFILHLKKVNVMFWLNLDTVWNSVYLKVGLNCIMNNQT